MFLRDPGANRESAPSGRPPQSDHFALHCGPVVLFERRFAIHLLELAIHLVCALESHAILLFLESVSENCLRDGNGGPEIDNCVYSSKEDDIFAWFPDGDRMLICRGFSEELPVPGTEEDRLGPTFTTVQHEPNEWDMYEELIQMHFGPMDADPAWELMTLPMQDWRTVLPTNRPWKNPPEVQPALRPLFDAPAGWTPAPDDSLASAILRSLAYGEGPERLDLKLIASVNQRVQCLAEMRTKLERDFENGLVKSGYTSRGKSS